MTNTARILPFERVVTYTKRPCLPKTVTIPFAKLASGRRSLIPYISEKLPEDISRYHELFVGDDAVFFAMSHLIQSAILADLNDELVLTYHVIVTAKGGA